ncbi:apolipoprotein D [Acrasis kona]|uniref:Apolipoprotein D n=1 Tax=Acrasis kona TaxID=1008807 RepID=A0AAW2YNB5_9EUKA
MLNTLKLAILALVVMHVRGNWFQKCGNLPTLPNFNAEKYLGLWYDIAHFDNAFTWFQKNGTCVTARYSLSDKPGHIVVKNSMQRDGKSKVAIADAYAPDEKYPSKLKVNFGSKLFEGNYHVIDTDYESYAMVYSCFSPLGIYKFEAAWILGRKNNMDEDLKQSLIGKWESLGVDTTQFVYTSHKDCQYQE